MQLQGCTSPDGYPRPDDGLPQPTRSGARLRENFFEVLLDGETRVASLTGTVFGRARLEDPADTHHALAGADLEDWLRSRGATAGVIAPLGPRRP
ncbi:hypothetical protein ABZ667_33900 [Streptomyces lavendulae]|uniref:hypothetical protein n=1 Tax=Streptomyces lavendulae TaxID=1914 RepID=UPI0033F3FAEB